MNETQNQLIINSPDEGGLLGIAGSVYRILLAGAQTQGRLAIIEMNVPPGSGPVPHQHPGFQETFYVLEGSVELRTKTQRIAAQQGAVVTIPVDGPVHSFKNLSDAPARLLCIVTPAGLDEFFKEAGRPLIADEQPAGPLSDEEKEKIKAAAIKYGQQLYPPDYFEQ